MKDPEQSTRVMSVSYVERTETAAAEPGRPAKAVDQQPGKPKELPLRVDDKRGAARYPFSGSAEAFEPRTRTRISGRVADLGVGGCYIDTVSPFAVGTEIRLRITSEGRILQVAALVTYATHGMGMGLAFTRMAPEQANILSAWLGELSGDAPPPSVDWDHEPEAAPASDSADSPKWLEAARELVELLKKKQILSDAESLSLLKKLTS